MCRAGRIDGGGCYETVKRLLREDETWQEPLADSAEAVISLRPVGTNPGGKYRDEP